MLRKHRLVDLIKPLVVCKLHVSLIQAYQEHRTMETLTWDLQILAVVLLVSLQMRIIHGLALVLVEIQDINQSKNIGTVKHRASS
jgi:hypothetical protein